MTVTHFTRLDLFFFSLQRMVGGGTMPFAYSFHNIPNNRNCARELLEGINVIKSGAKIPILYTVCTGPGLLMQIGVVIKDTESQVLGLEVEPGLLYSLARLAFLAFIN